jgi:hypothetical protein
MARGPRCPAAVTARPVLTETDVTAEIEADVATGA